MKSEKIEYVCSAETNPTPMVQEELMVEQVETRSHMIALDRRLSGT